MLLNLVSPINTLGYGTVGFNILNALVKRGHAVSYWPIGTAQWPNDNGVIAQARTNAQKFDSTAPCLRIWHQFEMDMFVGKGPHIGFPIFELDTLDERERHHLNGLDMIFVTSRWAKEVLLNNGIEPNVHVVPLGVDNTIFYHDITDRKSTYWTKEKTIFINVGKWEVRKGHRELIEAFCKAFNPGDPVELWMINDNDFIGPENEMWKSMYIESPMGQHIRIKPRVSSQDELKVLFNQADVGVWPAHAEGWNLEPLEMMACGGHVIATNYSGHTEYMNDRNAMLIEPVGMERAVDNRWFFGQGSWCKFNVDALVASMQHAHKLKQSGKLGVNLEGIKTATRFSWENSVKAIESVL